VQLIISSRTDIIHALDYVGEFLCVSGFVVTSDMIFLRFPHVSGHEALSPFT
jgi:hypothetical protein